MHSGSGRSRWLRNGRHPDKDKQIANANDEEGEEKHIDRNEQNEIRFRSFFLNSIQSYELMVDLWLSIHWI